MLSTCLVMIDLQTLQGKEFFDAQGISLGIAYKLDSINTYTKRDISNEMDVPLHVQSRIHSLQTERQFFWYLLIPSLN